MQKSLNSFFKFVLGFTVFIAVSLGLTFFAGTYALEREQQKQTAAAFQAMLGEEDVPQWWEFWK